MVYQFLCRLRCFVTEVPEQGFYNNTGRSLLAPHLKLTG
jgi:hypothetical protein